MTFELLINCIKLYANIAYCIPSFEPSKRTTSGLRLYGYRIRQCRCSGFHVRMGPWGPNWECQWGGIGGDSRRAPPLLLPKPTGGKQARGGEDCGELLAKFKLPRLLPYLGLHHNTIHPHPIPSFSLTDRPSSDSQTSTGPSVKS